MIQHVALETAPAEADESAAFFALLGFARVRPPPALRERSVWLARGDQQVHLLLTDDPVAPPQGHLALVVDDYVAVLEALREAGVEVSERAEHWGAPRCFVAAPGGHRVELMAAPPASAKTSRADADRRPFP